MSRTLGAGCLAILAALAACGREEGIRTYRAPKDPTWRMLAALVPAGGETWFFKVTALTADLAPHKADVDAFLGGLKVDGSAVTWTLPQGWTAAPSAGERQTTLVFGKGLELAVTRLPGAAGGVLANVNRWRTQMGLAPIAEAELAQVTRTLAVTGGRATVVELEGPKRPSGPPMAARPPEERRERDPKALRETVRSLFAFEKPSSWTENPEPAQRDRVYEFRAGEGAGAPLVTLTVFPGETGGVAANVNRWRAQAGLPELGEGEVEGQARRIGFLDEEGRLVECLGPERAILAAFRLGSELSVFLKMDGERSAVEGQRSTFEAFARNLRFARR